jgi:hypothetical protein
VAPCKATKATPASAERGPRDSDLGRIESIATQSRPQGQAAFRRIDPRLAFLACAAARFDLVERGAMTLDEAFSRDFVERFREIGRLTCHCERETMQNMDRVHLAIRERELRDWRRTWMPSKVKP